MKRISRKEFIKIFGLGSAAFAFGGSSLALAFGKTPKVGLQLYSVRNYLEKNFQDTIAKISTTGIRGVETYKLPENITLKKAAALLSDYELEVLAMHSELPVGENFDPALKMAEAYKSDIIVYHGWTQDDKYSSLDSMKKTAELYNNISYKLKKEGLKFALHNHWWEFEKQNGYYPFYWLLENLNDNILFEIDTYWATTAGFNPVKAVKDFGKRAPLLHIKDGTTVKGEEAYKQTPVGKGAMNFPPILEACGETADWLIIEFDEYNGDIFEGIKESSDYLSKFVNQKRG
jgi:sugar phosphate isomerase/epimerase